MSPTNQKRKYIATIAAAAIISGGLVQGMNLVGVGLAAKSGNSITVTGQAKTSAVADNASWTLFVQETSPTVATAVKKVEASVVKFIVLTCFPWLRWISPEICKPIEAIIKNPKNIGSFCFQVTVFVQ